jgi:hypothetical protein
VEVERAERMPLSAARPEDARQAPAENGEVELEVGESPVYLWLRPKSEG